MTKEKINLFGETIFLKILLPEDVSTEYLNWLLDKEINEFLEIRHYLPQSIQDLVDFVKKNYESDSNYLFGIFDGATKIHIGNIKLGDINHRYKRGDIGLFIGNKLFWRKGIAKEAISLVTKFGLEVLHLNKITAGAYSNNQGSIKAFIGSGFHQEGLLEKHYILDDGTFVDAVLMAKLK